jgi:hypothetical protein
VVLNSKDKAPYFAYMEVLMSPDKSTADIPNKMLEASLLDECQGTVINSVSEREMFSDEEDCNETIVPQEDRRDSTHTHSDDSSGEPPMINPNSLSADVVTFT